MTLFNRHLPSKKLSEGDITPQPRVSTKSSRSAYVRKPLHAKAVPRNLPAVCGFVVVISRVGTTCDFAGWYDCVEITFSTHNM